MRLILPLLFFTLTACVSPAQVADEDPRLSEEQLVLIAALQILQEEGYPVSSSTGNGERLASDWVETEDRMRRNVTVSVQQSSLGVALRTRVLLAVPDKSLVGPQPEGKETAPIRVDGETYWIDYGLRPRASKEESRIGKLIESRWLELRREQRSAP